MKIFKKLDKHKKKFILFICLSLLLHILTFIIPWPKSQPKEEPQKIFIVDSSELSDREKAQIVDDTNSANKKTPDKADFMSKSDNSAEEETKAQASAKTENRDESYSPPSPPKNQSPETKPIPETTPKKPLKLSDFGLMVRKSPLKNKPQQSPARMPSSTDDYLPSVKEGAHTSLNTREFKFYSYFERIKERLRMHWEPELRRRVSQLYELHQTLPDHDLITKLTIILNKNGELSKIAIVKNSGYQEIDGAAVKAFELAAPFPNPPSGMIEDGNVYLTWSFVLETRGGLSDIFVFLSQR